MPLIKLATFITSYYLLYKNTQFNKILYVICKLELYKCGFLPILRTVPKTLFSFFFKERQKKRKRIFCNFNYLKIPHALSCFRGSRQITPKEVGVTLSCAAQTPACCVNMIAFLWLSTEPRFHIYHTTFIFFPLLTINCSNLSGLKAVIATVLLRAFALFLIKGKVQCKGHGVKGVWSDRWCAVADLRGEFVGHLVRLRLLQHVVLHYGLLVSVDGGVCIVGVVPGLVPAGLIGRL